MSNMIIKPNKLKIFAWCIGALVLTSCLSDDIEYNGRLSLSVTDAPADNAKHVWITFSSVEVHRAKGSEIFLIDPVQRVDLLAVSGGASAPLLSIVELPAGDYEWIRFTIDAVEMVLNDGSQPALLIPPDALENFKVVSGFTVPLDGITNITVDFDLRKAITQTAAGYVLKPILRLVDNTQAGNIFGSVGPIFLANNAAQNGCTLTDGVTDDVMDKAVLDAAVYVFRGADVTPTDISGAEGDPIATARVRYDPDTVDNRYAIGFLPAAAEGVTYYTVALTCDAELDLPDRVDTVTFFAQYNVPVKGRGQTVYINFYVPPP